MDDDGKTMDHAVITVDVFGSCIGYELRWSAISPVVCGGNFLDTPEGRRGLVDHLANKMALLFGAKDTDDGKA